MEEQQYQTQHDTKVVGSIADRIKLCQECPDLNKLRMCKHCGCFMPAKVRLKSASCPIGKWGPVDPPKEQITYTPPHIEFKDGIPEVEDPQV